METIRANEMKFSMETLYRVVQEILAYFNLLKSQPNRQPKKVCNEVYYKIKPFCLLVECRK